MSQSVALTMFTGPTACGELEEHIEDRAVLEMRVLLETNKRAALAALDAMGHPYLDAGWVWIVDGGSIIPWIPDAGSSIPWIPDAGGFIPWIPDGGGDSGTHWFPDGGGECHRGADGGCRPWDGGEGGLTDGGLTDAGVPPPPRDGGPTDPGDGGPGNGGGWCAPGWDAGMVADVVPVNAGSAGSAARAAGPGAYTTTNTQVAGIDEPDIVKNDGTRLFVISGRRLFVVSTWPAAQLATRGSAPLGGRPVELFLEGDRVVVFSDIVEQALGVTSICQGGDERIDACANATLVTYLDVSDLTTPRTIATRLVPGRYQTARRVGTSMRLVTTSALLFLSSLPISVDLWDGSRLRTKAEVVALYDEVMASNEATLRARTLSSWLPASSLTKAGSTTQSAFECSEVSITNASARLGLTSLVTLGIDDPQKLFRQGLLAEVDQVYQGPQSLYLAQRHWWWWNAPADHSYVYRFELSQTDGAHFVGAGHLEGLPLNQFSFDEQEGQLRVATSQTGRSDGTVTMVSRVVVLGAKDGALVELGRTGDLGAGERLTGVRFIGDRAYVVTFRRTDPLHVIDLSQPSNPHQVGELQVPGFSTYLHPLDDAHLLTIGTSVAAPSTQQSQHVQLEIFDVSDPARPRLTHTQLVGEAWGSSEAQSDHKAFNYFPAKGLLAVPFADSYWDPSCQRRYVSDLRVYHVDPLTGFEAKGALEMSDLLKWPGSPDSWSWWWNPQVRRSVMADDFVYAISSGGIRVAQVDSLSQPVATAIFPPAP